MDDRQQVMWVGGVVPSAFNQAAVARRMGVVPSNNPSDEELAAARAAIFDIPKYSGAIAQRMDVELPRCLNHGVKPIVRINTPDVKTIQARFPEFFSRINCLDPSRTLEDLAEEARSGFDPGPRYQEDVLILGEIVEGEDLLLLKRAFGDCVSIELLKLTEGKSDAKVFRAYARLGQQAYILPFLIKLDSVDNIQLELKNFDEYISPHIPFSQRPNMKNGRSLLGATRGILVGDFVEDAVSLSRICFLPEARNIIYSIFDDALRSWRRHAYSDPKDVRMAFTELMPDLIRHWEISAEIEDKARKFGLKSSPAELAKRLTAASVFHYRRGIVHGDLHPGNVMMRGAEAILIDFLSVRPSAPLVADVACLEVACCFTVAADGITTACDRRRRLPFDVWRRTIDGLFSVDCLRYVPPLQESPSKLSWLWSVCRQTRAMAHQLGADGRPYASALAAYLMRRARLGTRKGESTTVAAYALYTAEKVLGTIEAGKLS